jgi:hypothetical protein
MEKTMFTKDEVVLILNELLERPQLLIDAVNNEMTDYDAETLLDIACESAGLEVTTSDSALPITCTRYVPNHENANCKYCGDKKEHH